MKRILLILGLLVLLCSPAIARMTVLVLGGGGGGASADSCSGGLIFSWHGEDADVTVGTPTGCSAGDETGTASSGATISSTQKKDGSNSVSIPTSSDYYSFTLSSSDIFNDDAGTVDFWIYMDTHSNHGGILRFQETAGTDEIYIRMEESGGNDELQVWHEGNSVERTAYTSVGPITEDTWYHVIVKWDTVSAHGGNYLSICADTTNGTTNCGTNASQPSSLSDDSGTLVIGDFAGWNGGDGYYLDLFKIYDSWQ
jgi:hypothetical protein